MQHIIICGTQLLTVLKFLFFILRYKYKVKVANPANFLMVLQYQLSQKL